MAGSRRPLLADLKQIDLPSSRDAPEAVTYKFLQNLLETSQGYRVCRIELWNVSPTWTGWQAEMPVIAGMQAVATPDGPETCPRAVFTGFRSIIDDEIANLRKV